MYLHAISVNFYILLIIKITDSNRQVAEQMYMLSYLTLSLIYCGMPITTFSPLTLLFLNRSSAVATLSLKLPSLSNLTRFGFMARDSRS